MCINLYSTVAEIIVTDDVLQYRKFMMHYHTMKPLRRSLIRHSMAPENNFGLGGCWIMNYTSYHIYLCMVIVPHRMVGSERMLDYRVSD